MVSIRLPKNILSGTAEPPEIYLCQADKTILGGLNVVEPSGVFKFNSYSEVTCEVDRVYQHPITGETIINPLYDKVEALRILYIVDFGYFQIQQAGIVSDGIREYKDVVAYSLEYELTQKYLDNFTINYGTVGSIDGVKLYNYADPSHSLIHLVLDKMDGAWKVGHVDMSLQDLQRSFEVDHQAIYDFMMNDMSDTFKCVFEFDTYDRVVNIYEEDKAGKETNIYVAMDTIANEVHVDYSADDIKTCLYVYGADDISIREVNLGLEYIMNIDYYNTVDWLGQELYDDYNKYCILVESYREEFSQLMLEWSEIYNQISELYNKIPDYEDMPDYDSIPTVYSKSDLPLASEKNVYMIYRVVEGEATWYYICKSELIDGVTTYRWVLDVDNISSFYIFPTPSIEYVGGVYKVYNNESTDGVLYYICESYQKDDWTTGYRWVLAEDDYGINMLKEKEQVYLTIQEIHVSAGFAEKTSDDYPRYLENYEKLIEIQSLLKDANAQAKELQTQLDTVMEQMNAISEIVRLENNFTPEQIANLNPFIREDEYKDDCFIITELDDDSSAIDTKQELMDAAHKELAKISQPQLSFSMEMANILAIPEFEPIVNDFECGNYVTIEVRPRYVVKTQILEVDINFSDMSDFNVVFGNLSSLHSQTDIHAALLSQAVTAGKSIAESGSYWKKGADTANSINKRIEAGLIDANTTIQSTENQAISWDSHGIHLRKYTDESKSTYEDDQIWMNNEKIVFTDDNWRTAKMAIGKFTDVNLGETYGIIAPSIVGTLLAGENLVIDSAKTDGMLSSFRVDSNGARLYNSTFLMEKEIEYIDENNDKQTKLGQIMIDPKYGIVAGNGIYTTNSDGTIVPQFVDNENNSIIKENDIPLNSNFFLDIESGSAYFRGIVYAQDGIFEGQLSGATGDFAGTVTAGDGAIGGWSIKDGYLHSGSDKTYVGLSSSKRYQSTDSDGNIITKTTDYAIWAGAENPDDTTNPAPFSVRRDGTVTMNKGLIKCGINVNNNFIVNSDGSVSIAKSIDIGNGAFSVDQNGNLSITQGNFQVTSEGNVIMNGSIELGGTITWSTPPIKYQYSDINSNDDDDWHDEYQEGDIYRRESLSGGDWGDGYQFIGEDGTSGLTDEEIVQLISNEYGISKTELDETSITSPIITGGEIRGGTFKNINQDTWFGLGEDNGAWGFNLQNKEYDTIFGVYNGDFGTTSFYGKSGYCFMMVNGGTTTGTCEPQGTWDFTDATVTFNSDTAGIVAVFG